MYGVQSHVEGQDCVYVCVCVYVFMGRLCPLGQLAPSLGWSPEAEAAVHIFIQMFLVSFKHFKLDSLLFFRKYTDMEKHSRRKKKVSTS